MPGKRYSITDIRRRKKKCWKRKKVSSGKSSMFQGEVWMILFRKSTTAESRKRKSILQMSRILRYILQTSKSFKLESRNWNQVWKTRDNKGSWIRFDQSHMIGSRRHYEKRRKVFRKMPT